MKRKRETKIMRERNRNDILLKHKKPCQKRDKKRNCKW